jgi:hypothetical protein
MDTNVKVRLKVDLTQYLNGLVAGTEGITIGRYGMWSRQYDHFTGVKFPMGSLDIAISSLEIIDEDYLKEIDAYKNKQLEALKTAKNIVVTKGPRGGFKELSYEYSGGSCGNGFKKESEELIEYFKSLGKEITVKYE